MDLQILDNEQLFEHLEEMAIEVKRNPRVRPDYDAVWNECCKRGLFHGLQLEQGQVRKTRQSTFAQ